MTQRSSSPEERKAVGGRLRETAKAAGYTSDEIAEKLGVQGGSVRGWWVGRNEPSLSRLQQYAELVKVSTGYLLFGVEAAMGPSGTLQEWRLRFAELVRQGVDPVEAIDRITGTGSSLPEPLTEAERELLSGAGPAMRAALEEASGGRWERLSPEQREAVLRLIETMTPGDEAEPK